MKIRDYNENDKLQVHEIFNTYWTDVGFVNRLLDKLDFFTNQSDEYHKNMYRFYVAVDDGEIVGVAGLRKSPEHMSRYALTDNPAELYVLASKYSKKGIGEALRVKRIEEAQKLGFTEVVLYSPDSHKDSWGFHDRLGFERVGPVIAPDGEPGMIWRKGL